MKKMLLVCIVCFLVVFDSKNVMATSLLEYDFSDVGTGIEDENFEIDFEMLVESLYENDFDDTGFVKKILDIFWLEIRNSIKFVSLSVGIIITGALFKNIAGILNDASIVKTGNFVTYIAVMFMLFITFEEGYSLTRETADKIMNFLYSLVPTFFCAVTFTNGSVAGSLLYQWTGLCLGVVNMMMIKFLIPMTNYYVVLSIINNCTEDKKFASMCRFVKKIIINSNKVVMGVLLGMTSIKSMTIPLSGTLKNTFLKKAISVIPGIGNGVESFAETVAGAGNLIKNTIGMAGLICVVIIVITPLIKLTVMNFLLRFMGAVTEPVSEKTIIGGIESIADGIGILQYIICTSCIVFMITIGIICMTTGGING